MNRLTIAITLGSIATISISKTPGCLIRCTDYRCDMVARYSESNDGKANSNHNNLKHFQKLI